MVKLPTFNLVRRYKLLLNWANLKMAEESEWEKLAKTNDAVKIALENMKKAKQQLDITAN
jgi:hypothetical protein